VALLQIIQCTVTPKPAFRCLFLLLQLAKLYIRMYPWMPAIATVGRAVVTMLDEAQQTQ
jgi:hypothetical protein